MANPAGGVILAQNAPGVSDAMAQNAAEGARMAAEVARQAAEAAAAYAQAAQQSYADIAGATVHTLSGGAIDPFV
ncbi:NAD(P) transhydrogenase subunit alpha, partial [Ancylobacter vacuolatus]